MLKLSKLFKVSEFYLIICSISILSSCASLNSFLVKEDYENAIKYCEKQKGTKQLDSYNQLGDHFFNKSEIERAANFYEKAENQNSAIKCYDILCTENLKNKKYEIALEYFKKANNEKGIMDCNIGLANHYFERKKYDKAIDYFKLTTEDPTIYYSKIIDDCLANQYTTKALFYLKKVE